MKKIIGFCMLAFCALMVFLNGAETFQSVLDIALFAVLVLAGIGLISSGESPSSAKSTAQPVSRPTSTVPAPEQTPPPQPQMVCPECGKKYPLDQIYCEECGSLLKKS